MSGIRVNLIDHDDVTEKLLHAHFANPSNGGGKIASIHFPMFGEHAVIIFEDDHTAEIVNTHKHEINGYGAYITVLPKLQVFKKLEAEIDPAATAFLQITEAARDEIIHHCNLDYRYDDKTDTAYMTGTWYQLEWAWKFIDDVMHQQERALRSSTYLKERQVRKERQCVRGYSPSRYSGQDGASGAMSSIDDPGNIQLHKSTRRIPDVGTTMISVPGHGVEGETDVGFSLQLEKGKAPRRLEKDMYESRETAEMTVDDKTTRIRRSVSEQGAGYQQANTDTRVARSMSVEEKDSEDLRGIDFTHEGIRIRLYTGDIISAKTESIVNTGMGYQTSVSYAILQAADDVVPYEIQDYFAKNGHLETGDVMETSAGGSLHKNVKKILHTVGPVWTEDLKQDVGSLQLTTTFLNCLEKANKLKLSSITFPAVSTGTYMGTVEVCAKSFLDAVLLYAFEHRDKHSLQEIHLVNIDANTTALMVLTLRQILKKGIDLLTIEATEEMERLQTKAKKNPGLFAKMKAGLSDFMCSVKKGSVMAESPTARTSSHVMQGITKPITAGTRPLPKPPAKSPAKATAKATGRSGKKTSY